ncbi:MAG: hypothetical protein AAGG57_11205 [Pseudomonadota bacterium]
MQIVLHSGAYFTEEKLLFKSILRNRESVSEHGIHIPGPGRYRRLMRERLGALGTAMPPDETSQALLNAVLDGPQTQRIILSHSHIFGAPRAALRNGQLYPNAPVRLDQLGFAFRDHQLRLFMAVRNPATFLPAILRKAPQEDMMELLRGYDPRDIRWSETFEAIRSSVPDLTITVWCSEDLPLVWATILHKILGMPRAEDVNGRFDLLTEIMEPEGLVQLERSLNVAMGLSEAEERDLITDHLERFAIKDAVEEELDVPNWTEDLIDEITEIYDEDMDRLAAIPGVSLIEP